MARRSWAPNRHGVGTWNYTKEQIAYFSNDERAVIDLLHRGYAACGLSKYLKRTGWKNCSANDLYRLIALAKEKGIPLPDFRKQKIVMRLPAHPPKGGIVAYIDDLRKYKF